MPGPHRAGFVADGRHGRAEAPSDSTRSAAAFVTGTIRTAHARGTSGALVVRADSAFYGAEVVNACRALDTRFSIAARMSASIKAAIARIDENAWTAIKYSRRAGHALRDLVLPRRVHQLPALAGERRA
ncbi:hypothetical protein [Streptomyces sp. NPDC048527]|uniref:hypothetical protein n=1 Tax=Streptomyces sp. NPDC048527 TaxID=3365568 RepID=UPI003710D074